jgi:hypothetical protein
MKERFFCRFWLRAAAMLMGPILIFSIGSTAWSEGAGESFTPSLISPSGQEDQSVLSRRLQAAKKDLEVFRIFAEHFNKNGELKTVGQFQSPIDDYLKRHVDTLLVQARENSALEVTRLSAEIMFSKTRLYLSLNRAGDARTTLAEMKKRFAPYLKITVQFAGKTTTLDEAIHQLDEELTKTTSVKKN